MILCFSGTGNSLYAARLISAAAGDEVVSLNALLRGGGAARFSSERPYVVVSPTPGWRLAAAVEALVSECGATPGQRARAAAVIEAKRAEAEEYDSYDVFF